LTSNPPSATVAAVEAAAVSGQGSRQKEEAIDVPDDEERARAMAEAYDAEATAVGWLGPEVAFGLAYAYVQPGQSILDIGIGTGLAAVLFRRAGLLVYGMDLDPQMLQACRGRGITELALHDLTARPYPYAAESVDHAVCVGVLNFFGDLGVVFDEVARILRSGGVFVFAVGDRTEDEPSEIVVGPEYTKEDASAKMYFHSERQVGEWVAASRLAPLRDLAFAVPMDRERTRCLKERAYVVRRGSRG
jgi:predicted TPR repeat methyltransferase